MNQLQSRPLRLLLCSALLGGFAMALLGIFLRPAVPKARAQSPSSDALLLELAQRLLAASPSLSVGSLQGAGQSVQLLPGALPPDLPLKLSLPPSSTLIGSAVRPAAQSIPPPFGIPGFVSSAPPQDGERTDIVLDAPQSPADIVSFYQNALSDLGWNAPPTSPYGLPGQFVPARPAASSTTSATFCQSSSGPWLSVNAAAGAGGLTDVRLHLETGTAGICAVPSVPPFAMPPPIFGAGLLPSLSAPDGVTVRTNGGGGSSSRYTSDAIAITSMNLSDLYSAYAQQLTATDWSQTDSGQSSGLAWSDWSIPDHNDNQGFLYVRTGPAAGQFSLHVEVASTDPNAQPGNGAYSFGSAVAFPAAAAVAGQATPAPTPAPTATPTPSP